MNSIESASRYYVRFKGKRIGPLEAEKIVSMVRRGQLTRRHELSRDGSSWQRAENFQEFFASDGQATDVAPANPSSNGVAGDSIAGNGDPNGDAGVSSTKWYMDVDGKPSAPINEADLRRQLSAGTIPWNTRLWHEGITEWTEAAELFPELASAAAAAPGGPGQTGGAMIDPILQEVVTATRSWTLTLSVFFYLLSAALLGLCGLSFWESVGAGDDTKRPLWVMQTAFLFFGFGMSLVLGNHAAKITGAIGAVQYQANTASLIQVARAVRSFYVFCVVVAAALALMFLVGLKMYLGDESA